MGFLLGDGNYETRGSMGWKNLKRVAFWEGAIIAENQRGKQMIEVGRLRTFLILDQNIGPQSPRKMKLKFRGQ